MMLRWTWLRTPRRCAMAGQFNFATFYPRILWRWLSSRVWSGRRESNPRMQLGKLDVSQNHQEDSCKTEPLAPQRHQRVRGEKQNCPVAFPLSAAASAVYDKINAAESADELDNLARSVWAHWPGALTEDEANFLANAIDQRRPVTFDRPSRTGAGLASAVGGLRGRIGSRFAPRPCRRRLGDEELTRRRHRKRMLGGSSAMPDTI